MNKAIETVGKWFLLYIYQMGGHGGLNILPQKKWNVYNYDNRAIVDKDKKEAAAKKRAEYERNRQNGLQGKLDVLKEEMGIVP